MLLLRALDAYLIQLAADGRSQLTIAQARRHVRLTDIAEDMEATLGPDVEAEVVAAYQPAHPLTGTIAGVAALDEGDDGEPLLIDGRPIVWIVVGGHPDGFGRRERRLELEPRT